MKRPFGDFIFIVLLAASYFAVGKLGLALASVHPSATTVWPPTGITLAALLLRGYHVWPGIFVGAFLVNATTAGSIATSLGIAVGNTLEGLVGAYLVQRFARGRAVFEQPESFFTFVALAACLSTMVSATIGVSSLSLGGFIQGASYGAVWITWWLGDMVGDLIVAPFLILWGGGRRLDWKHLRSTESLLLLIVTLVVGLVVFNHIIPALPSDAPLEFLCIPVAIWAAYRFGQRTAVSITIVLAGFAIWGTVQGLGPFARSLASESLMLLQLFMATISVMALTLAAAVAQQQQAIAALQSAQSQSELLYQKAQEAVLVRDRFISIASHELKTPITILLGYSELLFRRTRDTGSLSARDQRAVEALVSQTRRLRRLVETMLDLSRLQTGHFQLEQAPIDLRIMVQRIINEIQPLLDHHTVTCTGISTALMINGDELRLSQSVYNLIENAVKYSPEGGAIEVLFGQQDQTAYISVVDHGIGIPQAALPQLFQRFYRASNVEDQHISGLGIGLYIVAEVVSQHGGAVTVDSCEGHGSTFTIRLPLIA